MGISRKCLTPIIAIIISCVDYSYPNVPENRFINELGMVFVYIPPGTFVMGSPRTDAWRKDDETPHQVTINTGYYMQITEVTQGQWQAVMGANPSTFKECGDDCPVETVSWLDAQDFIRKFNRMDKHNEYRLPTEAEWEYACRAGTTMRYAWGDEADCREANYGNSPLTSECQNINPGRPSPVGSYQANPWGLYDMHGNVWEWCADRYGAYESTAVTDPGGVSNSTKRVLRGGAFFDPAESCRTANRCWDPSDYRVQDIGFRLIRRPVQ